MAPLFRLWLLALLLIPAGIASAAEVWVNPAYEGETQSGSEEEPYTSIDAAVAAIESEGGSIYLAEGEYEDGQITVGSEDVYLVYLTVIPVTRSGGESSGTMIDSYWGSTPEGDVILDLDMGTEITGPDSWDGLLFLPLLRTLSLSIPGFAATSSLAVEVGSFDEALTLDRPARITFEGQEGKQVGWVRNGVLTEITEVCDANEDPEAPYTQAYLIPEGSEDCKTEIPGQDDMYVWTRHFTTFVTFDSEALPEEEEEEAPVEEEEPPAEEEETPEEEPAPEPEPEVVADSHTKSNGRSGQKKRVMETGSVLGASSYNFSTDLTLESVGPDVIELQRILIQEGFLTIPEPTGWFGPMTKEAARLYQVTYGVLTTGYVGPLTRAVLNARI